MKSFHSIVSVTLLFLPAVVAHAKLLDGWATPMREDHARVTRTEVRDVQSLFTRINNNQAFQIPVRDMGPDGSIPASTTDAQAALRGIKGRKGEKSVGRTANKAAKAEKCKKSKKDKGSSGNDEDEDDCSDADEDLPPVPAPTASFDITKFANLIRFDVEPPVTAPASAPVTASSPVAWVPSDWTPSMPTWTYAPAWTPAYSPAATLAPAVAGRSEIDSTFAPIDAPIEAPATAPITVAPVVSPSAPVTDTSAPISPTVAMTRLTKAPVTYSPVTSAPGTAAPVTSNAFHFPDDMIHHTGPPVASLAPIESVAPITTPPVTTAAPVTVPPVATNAPVTAPPVATASPVTIAPVTTIPITTAAPVTAAPVDPDMLDTTGATELSDASRLHSAVVEEIAADGTPVYKLQIETGSLVVLFGGPDLDLSSIQAIMYEKLDTLLGIYYIDEIGTKLDNFDLNLNFGEEIIDDATGEENVTSPEGGTTAVIGSVEVGTTINLKTSNSIELMDFDETSATDMLRSFFESTFLQQLLNELDSLGLGLSFMELKATEMTFAEAIATHNVGGSNEAAGSTFMIAGALAGVMVFVTGAALLTRRWNSNDDDSIHQFDGEEGDQLHPLSGSRNGDSKAESIGFPSMEDIEHEEEDSMGSDTFLDWARPERSKSRIRSGTVRDEDGDLFPIDL